MTSRAELEEIAALAAQKAVNELFVTLGVNTDEPIEMQKDFSHLRSWRKSSEAIHAKIIMTAIGVFVVGLCGAIWLAIRGH